MPPFANSRASSVGLWFVSLLFGLVFFGCFFFFPRGKAHTFFLSDCLISQRHFSQDFTDLIPVVEVKDFKIVSDALFRSFRKYPPVLL